MEGTLSSRVLKEPKGFSDIENSKMYEYVYLFIFCSPRMVIILMQIKLLYPRMKVRDKNIGFEQILKIILCMCKGTQSFYPTTFKGCVGIVFIHGIQMGGWAVGKSLSGLYLRTMVGTLVQGCGCATSWYDLDLTFDLAVVTLTFNILSGLYLGKFNVQEVDTW